MTGYAIPDFAALRRRAAHLLRVLIDREEAALPDARQLFLMSSRVKSHSTRRFSSAEKFTMWAQAAA